MSEAKVILLEHRLDYQCLYGLNLYVYLGVEVLVAITIKEVVEFIQKNDTALIFVDASGYSVDVAHDLYRYLEKENLKIPYYVIGKTKAPSSEVTIFDSNIQLKHILQSIAKSLGVTAKIMAEKSVGKYFPMPLKFILPGWQTEYDLLIKNGTQLVPKVSKDNIIDCDLIDELEGNTDSIYIESIKRLKFVNSLTSQIFAKLNDPTLTPQERVKTTATAYQMVMEQSRRIGIAQSTLDMANKSMDSMKAVIEICPKLDDLLDLIMRDQSSLRYKLSFLISYIGLHIIKKMPWSSKEQQEIFSFLAFFHNIALTKDKYIKYRSDNDIESSDLDTEEKKLIINHAQNAAILVGKAGNKIPFGTDTIIKQHHGSKRGVGLSKISLHISPLAIVFIFSEEWAMIALDSMEKQKKPNKQKIIKQLHTKYNYASFNKVLPVLHTLEF